MAGFPLVNLRLNTPLRQIALGSSAIKLPINSRFTKIDFAVKRLIEVAETTASPPSLRRILGFYSAATAVGST
jgi:hypothetical protein